MLNNAIADTVNATFRRLGLALRLEFISPSDAKLQLEQNPALLAEHDLTQKMAGDASDNTLDAAKGRPFANTLASRINAGKWRTYMGVLARLENGGVVDGVTRLIAIALAGETDADFKGVWVLTFNDADPLDFYMYDDPDSARQARDVIRAGNYASSIASILAVAVVKAAGGADQKTGRYQKVNRDKWFAFLKKNENELIEAAEFARKEKGDATGPLARRNLFALMYYTWVTQKGVRNTPKAKEAKRLLEAFKNGYTSRNQKDEVVMAEFNHFLHANRHKMHERAHCLPLFNAVIQALLAGDSITYHVKDESTTDGRRAFRTIWKVVPKKRAAVAGR